MPLSIQFIPPGCWQKQSQQSMPCWSLSLDAFSIALVHPSSTLSHTQDITWQSDALWKLASDQTEFPGAPVGGFFACVFVWPLSSLWALPLSMYIELSSFEKISFNCSRPQGPLQAYGLKTSFSEPHPLHTTLVERVELRTFGIQSSNPSSYGDVSWPLQFGDQYGQSLRSDRLSRCQWEGLHQLLKKGNVVMLCHSTLSFHSVSRHQQSSKESQECGANSSSFPGTELSLTQEDLRPIKKSQPIISYPEISSTVTN